MQWEAVDGDGAPSLEWLSKEACEQRGLAALLSAYDSSHAGQQVRVVNTGAQLSRGASRNLGSVALPSVAERGTAAGGEAGTQPKVLVGHRTADDRFAMPLAPPRSACCD